MSVADRAHGRLHPLGSFWRHYANRVRWPCCRRYAELQRADWPILSRPRSVVADGIIDAIRANNMKQPVVVRVKGTGAEEAKRKVRLRAALAPTCITAADQETHLASLTLSSASLAWRSRSKTTSRRRRDWRSSRPRQRVRVRVHDRSASLSKEIACLHTTVQFRYLHCCDSRCLSLSRDPACGSRQRSRHRHCFVPLPSQAG